MNAPHLKHADIGSFPALPAQISIREVGLRDGLQIEKPISTAAKLELLDALVATGVRRIEATAFVSPSAVPALADAAEVASAVHRYSDVVFSALVASVGGAARALDAGMANLEYVVSAADGHSMANVRRSTEESIALVPEIAKAVHSAGGTLEVIFAVAWDCPFDGPTPPDRVIDLAARAVDGGADVLCLGDTIGTTTPRRMVDLAQPIRLAHPDVPVGLHMHNTRGAALATILAAMQIGITDIDSSIGGLGGCPFAPGASGNVATEELVNLCRDMDVATGIDLDKAIDAARLAQSLIGRELPSGVLRAGPRRDR
ncbi:hydroxymethylglutaryl-CoA lyase [Mycolicibacterium anyangense]|uniref:Hydroxymethylglutaryl-CoA lyase n=1 Tax=Mycolicibacterium anyangense TaxID=1431246 RepID=A0A6N4WC54_9MYCO|nr:hydroxymethylglutaryl-CoA lyase [Mycolicibacterium anyangense]BBZ78609.1 hydroxymethylglutaryl-CoA lyase [Mycolicibacterium anyangense]